MKKVGAVSIFSLVALLALTGCNPSNSSSAVDWQSVADVQTEETNIGSNTTPSDFAKTGYTEANPLKMALVTDSGTLNDHSFNESSYKGLNEFAARVGGGTLNASTNTVDTGAIVTKYYQPANDHFDTTGRLAAMKEAVKWGAKVLVLPGYLFQSAIKRAIDDEAFKDVYLLALDCQKSDDDNGYAAYEYTNKVTSITYREEQAGFLAGYAAASDGYSTFGFIGGMAVPAVIRYGSGYVQGIAAAFKDLGKTEAAKVNYYYAGAFAATAEATANAKTWYSTGTSDIIFACGGAVYQSVVEASIANNNAPWIGVDVNQHADTSLGTATLSALKTSAMKNLKLSVEVALADFIDNNCAWGSKFASNVVNVGIQSDMCKLPTPSEDDDDGCWGFTNFQLSSYASVYTKVKDGTYKINGNSDNDELSAKNFGVDPSYCVVNYIG